MEAMPPKEALKHLLKKVSTPSYLSSSNVSKKRDPSPMEGLAEPEDTMTTPLLATSPPPVTPPGQVSPSSSIAEEEDPFYLETELTLAIRAAVADSKQDGNTTPPQPSRPPPPPLSDSEQVQLLNTKCQNLNAKNARLAKKELFAKMERQNLKGVVSNVMKHNEWLVSEIDELERKNKESEMEKKIMVEMIARLELRVEALEGQKME
ncbi:hypothetical protein EJ08DRAFT_695637 [Tothia fuscella]|uniref:Uncharacterized protein n=1 Tax=Tothia fuscella TaxID=1048955 RepID=A0A9P4TZ73_9PEZI|nr:hypothetical protein EJ08DRAFT_695637 [Tothia fuscella]